MLTPYFEHFHPRVLHVLLRDETHWPAIAYQTEVPVTQFHNFTYVLRGEGSVEVNGQAWELGPESIYHFARGSSIRVNSSKSSPLVYLTVHYWAAWLDWDGLQPTVAAQTNVPLPWPHRFEIKDPRVKEELLALFRNWNQTETGQAWKGRVAFLSILQKCEEELSGRRREENPHAALLEESARYIRKHYRERLNREQLAKACSLSVSYYSVLFKQHTGLAPNEYVTAIRLQHAMERLRTSNDPINEIARESGFADPLYFAKVFTRHMGLSPREYRKG